MILKWQSWDGPWQMVDGVTDIISHGLVEADKMRELVTRYDGKDAEIVFRLHAEYDYEKWDGDPQYYNYVVATVRGQRQHMAIEALRLYVLSDEGKTVDKLAG